MTFDEALAEPGPLVVARDLAADPDGDLVLHVIDVAAAARRLATAVVPRDRRLAEPVALRRRGLRLASTYGGTGVVWLAEDHAFTVWTRHARAARCDLMTLELADGLVAADSVVAFTGFVADDYIRRGVLAERRHGDPVLVVDEHDRTAELDFTYSRNELIMSDAWWVAALARALGEWLGVPWRDDVFGLGPPDPAFVAALRAAADRLAWSPTLGSFPPIDLPFTALGTPASLRLVADSFLGRTLELHARDLVRPLARGTHDELGFYLCGTDAPSELERTLRQLRADAP